MIDIRACRDKLPAQPLEIKLARAVGTSPGMVRFWSARLTVEMMIGRALDAAEAVKLMKKIYGSFPRVGNRRILWPEMGDS